MANAPNLDRFPADLKALRRWVSWRYVRRGTRMTKRPLQSTTRPCAWLASSEACDLVARGEADGVGFVLGEGVLCSDLDNCIGLTGTLHEIAKDAMALATYIEQSPSGRGLHIWIRARISRSRNIGPHDGVPRHEIYDGRAGSTRFVTVTGNRIGDASELRSGSEAQAALDAFVAKWFPDRDGHVPPNAEGESGGQVLSDDAILQLMFAARNGARSRSLFEGDCSGYGSHSEADLALCGRLRFFTRADPAQIDRLFRRSGLMRPKWDERRGNETYGERTIAKALATGGRLYRDPCVRYIAGVPERQFGKVHPSVLAVLGRLTKTDILTYVGVALHANETGECFPSAARVAGLFGSTREHVQASIGTLGRAGLLSATKRRGNSSIFQLPAYQGASKFDTGGRQPSRPSSASGTTYAGKRRKRLGRPRPVSDLDTPPVSKFDTQTDKEQSIDTGEREATDSENEDPDANGKIIPFPEPCIPLRPSARALRDDMLRGPLGRLFLGEDAKESAAGR